jgi:outer membrane immunogenic protein
MRHFVIAVSAALIAGSALGADLPSRKAPILPPPPPPPLWTGIYVGVNAGGTWANDASTDMASSPIAITGVLGANVLAPWAAAGSSVSVPGGGNGGFIGGGQIGYNWQFNNSFVAGIEADIQGVAGNRSSSSVATSLAGPPAPFLATTTTQTVVGVSKSLDYIGTVRGRLGWLVTPTLLLYGTGGLAYGGVNSSTSIAGGYQPTPTYTNWFSAGSFSDTRVGWTAGGGVEWLFLPNWSAKVEYLYYDLGTVTYSGGAYSSFDPVNLVFSNASQVTTRFHGNIVRAGLNYHFNWGAPSPVVAKY